MSKSYAFFKCFKGNNLGPHVWPQGSLLLTNSSLVSCVCWLDAQESDGVVDPPWAVSIQIKWAPDHDIISFGGINPAFWPSILMRFPCIFSINHPALGVFRHDHGQPPIFPMKMGEILNSAGEMGSARPYQVFEKGSATAGAPGESPVEMPSIGISPWKIWGFMGFHGVSWMFHHETEWDCPSVPLFHFWVTEMSFPMLYCGGCFAAR